MMTAHQADMTHLSTLKIAMNVLAGSMFWSIYSCYKEIFHVKHFAGYEVREL